MYSRPHVPEENLDKQLRNTILVAVLLVMTIALSSGAYENHKESTKADAALGRAIDRMNRFVELNDPHAMLSACNDTADDPIYCVVDADQSIDIIYDRRDVYDNQLMYKEWKVRRQPPTLKSEPIQVR